MFEDDKKEIVTDLGNRQGKSSPSWPIKYSATSTGKEYWAIPLFISAFYLVK